ncbi:MULTISPECIES: hypothetical protein [Paenibacillus]|uniref:Uncharacterized protein n=1 Tax=Paenibacillus vandeheii TaxID=3035917 RepID=A0ABT8JFU6_9BACL|nr:MULTISPECIES: hypothetical protein [Paenibacillus]KGP81981.1 hypothetical protein P364_0114275 [Paenibacillus sp. MAEPY2]KGP86067.1 hypothetical protein P363_0119750 [Paenibacillus sp. MAEPY1]MDN4603900.1 hypothetical protein [Paenibacillus vandeheii]
MDIVNRFTHYKIRFSNESVSLDELNRIKIHFQLLNDRYIDLKVHFNQASGQILYIEAPINVEEADLKELTMQHWQVARVDTLSDLKLRPLLQYFTNHNQQWYVFCCLPFGNQSQATLQIRNIQENNPNVTFAPELSIYRDMSFIMDNAPAEVAELIFYSFKEYVDNNDLSDPIVDAATSYAQYYRRLRTISQLAMRKNIVPKFTTLHGKPIFEKKNYFIERARFSKPTYVGSQFENKNVILSSRHSHNTNQSQYVDVILFSVIQYGYMTEQLSVYVDPSFFDTPEVTSELISYFRENYHLDSSYELRMLFDIFPIRSSKETGTYLLPSFPVECSYMGSGSE